MTPSLIMTCGTIIATWHDVSLTRDRFFKFLKNNNNNNIKNQKNQKIQELTHDTPFNTVTTPVTERF